MSTHTRKAPTGSELAEAHLRDKPEASVDLYRRLEKVLLSLGGVTLSPSKTTIGFKGTRRGFAGARPTSIGVQGYFDIMEQLSTADPRIRRATPYQRNLYVHHFQLTHAGDLDDEFLGWLHQAHAVGTGAHLQH